MLVSPEFLFRIERDPPTAGAGAPSPRQRRRARVAPLVLLVEHDSRRRAARARGTGPAEAIRPSSSSRCAGCSTIRAPTRWSRTSPASGCSLRNVETVKPDPVIFPFDEALRQSFRDRNVAVRLEHLSRGPQPARSARGRLHVRQPASGRALRHPARLRIAVPARLADRRESPRSARPGQRAHRHVVPEPHLRGAARQVDSREPARHAAAAAAARRSGAEGGASRQGAVDARADAGAPRQRRCAPPATRGWIRSASRWRTTMASGAGAARTRVRRSTRAASCPTAPNSRDRPG